MTTSRCLRPSSFVSLLLACLLGASAVAAPTQGAVVETMSGKVRGVVDGEVVSFKGIPFAAPPVGELRWRAPQPPAQWDGVRDASEFGSHCPQDPYPEQATFGAPVDEDCLYLNVWTPRQRGENLLPVMVWIHGGGFVANGTANPDNEGAGLARLGLLLVSANYRLGRFGFFAHPALTAENADGGRLGNYAIMDQIAALHWVQDNIAAFGGDPDNVTIFGESAGGVSVHHLMTSPRARGLFARAICESGLGRSDAGAMPFLALTASPGEASAESAGLEFAARHGIEGTDGQALRALRALPASPIVSGLNLFTRGGQPFAGPIEDGTLVPAHFEDLYRVGRTAPVPLIIGANDADSFFPGGNRDQIFAPFGEFRAEAEAIYDLSRNGDVFRIGTQVWADRDFIEPARHIARMHAANGHPTYVYRFSYVPDSLRAQQVGAAHYGEVPFVFGTLDRWPGRSATRRDRRVSDEIQAYWVAFAKTGVPDPDGPPTWPRYDPDEDVILDFRLEGPTLGPDPTRERLDFAERVAEHRRGCRYFDSDGVRIRYVDVGPRGAEPIVLVHGGFNSVEGSWVNTGVIDALEDDYRVIAPDLRGHGKSDKPHDPAQYGAQMAADVIRLLDHLGIEQTHIVGYSMGGHITFKLVADHSERIRSAMPCGDGGRPASGAFADAVRRTIASLEASGSIRPVLDYFVTPGSMTAEEVGTIDAALGASNDSEAMAAMLRNWQGMDADPAKLAASRVPCLVVIGEGDPLRADLEATAERMPNLRVEIMRGHDHMTAFQDPEFAAAIRAFVRKHASDAVRDVSGRGDD